jgi:ribosome production factor 2|tara:strand:- start:1092 stop:2039 length:948 start_codon:yes stop_codon:yes gene_type:complete
LVGGSKQTEGKTITMPKRQKGRVARYLKNKEPKAIEDEKIGLFIRGAKTSEQSLQCLRDLYQLKKPAAVMFSRKNQIRVWEDESSLEFLCDKNDAAISIVATHSKKRPHNLQFCRIFDGHVLDKIEVGIDNFISVEDHRAIAGSARTSTAIGSKPCFIFEGSEFENDVNMRLLKSMLLDTFRGPEVSSISLAGLERVCVCTAVNGVCYFRHYTTGFAKTSESGVPRITLIPSGPSIDMSIRRVVTANPEVERIAMKRPKLDKKKHVKNVGSNAFSDRVGRLHMGKQDLSKLQLRKVKALKKRKIDQVANPEQQAE